MDTLTVALAETCPVLFGSSSFKAFGFTRVDVTKKKISRRKTISVMDDIENSDRTFVFLFIAIAYSVVSGAVFSAFSSLRISMKSMVLLSIMNTKSDIREVR